MSGIDGLSQHARTLQSNGATGEIMCLLERAEELKDFGLSGVHAKLLFGKIEKWKREGLRGHSTTTTTTIFEEIAVRGPGEEGQSGGTAERVRCDS